MSDDPRRRAEYALARMGLDIAIARLGIAVRGQPYPGQKYKHGWIPVAGTLDDVPTGSQQNARNAAIIHVWQRDLPPGWTRIGRGEHRTAYRGPDGTVYKVGSNRVNRKEAAILDELAETIPDNIPRHELYEVRMMAPDSVDENDEGTFSVLAMEYVGPDGTEATDDMARILAATAAVGALDLNPKNWVVRNGHLMLIDAGGVN